MAVGACRSRPMFLSISTGLTGWKGASTRLEARSNALGHAICKPRQTLSHSGMAFHITQQCLRAAVLATGRRIATDHRPQRRRQFLAKLHPPLIEGVDPKDHPFDEHPVFIKSDDLAQHL